MDTLHTVLNRGRSVWDRARLPEDEFRRRLGAVRAGMKERGVDLLLVYGDSWKYGNLAYVSHFIPKNRGAMAVIPMEGEPALVIQEPSRNNPFSSTLTWIAEVHSVGKFVQGLAEALKPRSLKPRQVGLVAVEEQLNIREWRELVAALEGSELRNCADLLAALRSVKSTAEIALIRQASEILVTALSPLKEIKAGQKEYELCALAEREARRRGVEDFRFLLARSSTPGIGLRPPADSALKTGEAVYIFVAASYQRYWAEFGRTFCLGQPPDEITSNYELASRVFRRLVDATKASISPRAATACLSEVPALAVRDSLQAYGLGNGLGLDLSEEPFLGNQTNDTIKPGMALTLRACFTTQASGCALIARPYLVTESGLQSLANSEEKLVVVPNFSFPGS